MESIHFYGIEICQTFLIGQQGNLFRPYSNTRHDNFKSRDPELQLILTEVRQEHSPRTRPQDLNVVCTVTGVYAADYLQGFQGFKGSRHKKKVAGVSLEMFSNPRPKLQSADRSTKILRKLESSGKEVLAMILQDQAYRLDVCRFGFQGFKSMSPMVMDGRAITLSVVIHRQFGRVAHHFSVKGILLKGVTRLPRLEQRMHANKTCDANYRCPVPEETITVTGLLRTTVVMS